jgi:hypothetical protein
MHDWPAMQTRPQPPQFEAFVSVSVQTPLHVVWPAGHPHELFAHD